MKKSNDVYKVLRERKYDQEYHIQEISKIVVHRYKQIEILKYKKKFRVYRIYEPKENIQVQQQNPTNQEIKEV